MDEARRVRSQSFGAVVDAYDRYRPSYPPELVDAVAGRLSLGARVVDVGCGTGRATVELARRGLRVTGVEPDEVMAARCRSNCAEYPAVDVIATTFEDWDGPLGSFDGVTAGQSWHWIDEDVGTAKAAAVLRPGGILALFWNTPWSEGTDRFTDLQEIYQRLAPGLAEPSVVLGRATRAGDQHDRLAANSTFGSPERAVWEWVQDYSTEEYVGLLRSYSDHSTLPEENRRRLLDAVAAFIDHDGGVLRYGYRSELVMATRLAT